MKHFWKWLVNHRWHDWQIMGVEGFTIIEQCYKCGKRKRTLVRSVERQARRREEIDRKFNQ